MSQFLFNKVNKITLSFALISVGCLSVLCERVSAQQAGDSDTAQARIAHARALAAGHRLDAAETELTAILAASKDDSVRDVGRIMLMNVYLEQADYPKAQALLDATFASRSPKDEGSTHNYFALAGQVVNGAREHIARYRSFGINISDRDLHPESVNDLNRLRLLLDRVAEQAKALSSDDNKATDAFALLEDLSSVRTVLARDQQERELWQREFENARERLAASEPKIGNRIADSTGTGSAQQNKPTMASSAPMIPATSVSQTSTVSQTGTQPNSAVTPAAATISTPSSRPDGTKSPVNLGSLANLVEQSAKPSYPAVAKNARIAGDVVVYLELDERGKVSKVERSTGPELLQGAAEDAARRCKFRPVLIDGQPARVAGFISFRFSANP